MSRRVVLIWAALASLALFLHTPAVAGEWSASFVSSGNTATQAEPQQCPASTSIEQISVEELKPGVQVAQRCCKICRKGKACGNSCIKRSYTCHQPPGCACDG